MTDRRAFIAGLAVAPTLLAVPASAAIAIGSWDHTMREWRSAVEAYDAIPDAAADAVRDELYYPKKALEKKLMAMAAPNLAAVAWKIGILQTEAEWFQIEPKDFNIVLADLRNLAA